MSVLTWRNVDAPASRGTSAISGLTAAAQLLQGSAGGLSDAIGQFGNAQTTLANNAAAQAASRFQDADPLKAALADGSLIGSLQGVDPSRVDAATLGTINNRVGTLLNNATTQQNLVDDRYKQGRLEQTNSALDQARPAIAAMANAARNRDQAAFAKAASDPSLSQLQPADILKAYSDTNAIEQGRASLAGTDLSNQGTGIQNQRTAFELTTAKRNDADQQSAMAAGTQLAHAADATDFLTQYNQLSSNLSPGAAAIVRQQGEARFPGIFGGSAGVGGVSSGSGGKAAAGLAAAAGAGGNPLDGTSSGLTGLGGAPLSDGEAGTENGGMYNVTFGYKKTDKPITTMSIDDLTKRNGLQDTLAASNGNHSPIGAYQITRDTLQRYAKKLGISADTAFTPAVQDQIGKAIFDDSKKGDLTAIWQGLDKIPNANVPGAFKDMSWDQAKGVITQYEGTAKANNGQDLRDSLITTQRQLGDVSNYMAQKIATNNANGVPAAVGDGVGVKSDAGDEAAKLIATKPAFKGADSGWLTDEINKGMQDSGLNARQVSNLIAKNLQSNHGSFKTALASIGTLGGLLDPNHTMYSPNLPSGQRINDDGLKADLIAASKGQGITKYNETQHISQLSSQFQAAQQRLSAAANDYFTARQRAAADPVFRQNTLPRYESAYQSALAQAQLLRATAVNDQSVNFPKDFGKQ